MIRLGLPSEGLMAADTLDLLRDCQLSVRQVNPLLHVAEIPQLPNVEVWIQRSKDIVRKLISGDLDLCIVGLDTLSEYGQGNEDPIIVHDALEYGECRLSLAVIANMRGSSAEEVAEQVLGQPLLFGLQIGGSGILVSPLTYIFDEEPPRWLKLLSKLDL